MSVILIIISSLLVAGGQVLLKKALTPVIIADKTVVEMYMALIKGMFAPQALLALAVVGTGSLIYFLALRIGSVSSVVPATAGLIIAFTALIGFAVMKDPMPMIKIAGLLLIITGVYLVSRPA